jgi:2-dehydropantoate 2-reductase
MDNSFETDAGRRSYAILGAGALGGLYGGLLAKSGLEVHFLLRSDFAHVRDHGLKVDTPLGNFHLDQIRCYERAADMPQVDVAIVAWKTTGNAALKATLESVCGPHTVVLVLQNGWDIERDAAAVVGAERVLGGCCFLCSNKLAPGHIHHLDYGRIAFGEFAPGLAGKITPRMQEIENDFRAAQIDMQPEEDLRSVRWHKLAWNIPFNGLSVVLSADTRQIMSDPSSAVLAEQLMEEVREAARVCGSQVSQRHIQRMLDDTRKMVPYDSSMLLDYRAARPMEVEAIFGNPLRAAQAAGYTPAKIESLYYQLCFLDRQRRQLSTLDRSTLDPSTLA